MTEGKHAADRGKLIADFTAWAGNVSSSVGIIFINKVLMSTTGYGFRYGGRSPAALRMALAQS